MGDCHIRVAVLCALVASGCGASPTAPTPDAPAPITAPPPDVPTMTTRFFGVVSNEDGVPLPGAMVTVTYVPDSGPAQTLNAQTGIDGRYELQMIARQPGNLNALIRATATDYLPNEQLVRMAAAAERNIRLRGVRTIGIGQSTQVRFDADSSRCTKPGTIGICESIRIRYPNTFVERIEVRANGGGAVVPTLVADLQEGDSGLRFVATRFVGQGGVTILANGEWWDLYAGAIFNLEISVPDGAAPQRYEVTVQ